MRFLKHMGVGISTLAVASLLAFPYAPVAPSFADEEPASTSAASSQESSSSSSASSAESSSSSSSSSDNSSKNEDASKQADSSQDGQKAAQDAKGDDSSKDAGKDKAGKDKDSAKDAKKAKEKSDKAEKEAAEQEKADKAIEKSQAARAKASDAAGKLSGLKAELASAREHYDEVRAKTAKLEKKLEKLKKKVAAETEEIGRAENVIASVEKELRESKGVGLFAVVSGRATFDDIDSREYLLKKVSADREQAIERLQKLQIKQDKASDELKRNVAEQKKAEAEAGRLGNKVAFEIEKQASKVRSHDEDAADALKGVDTKLDGVSSAKRRVSAAKESHDYTRKDVDKSVAEWYDYIGSVYESDGSLSFGEGADFALEEAEFVEKWGKAIDTFYGSKPLGGYGKVMAEAAYKFKIDPRLCAAVSIIESTGGMYCIRPHNAWGWGAADSDPYNLASEWGSWESAIYAWHSGMRESTTGLATAKTLDELGAIYCSGADWSGHVAAQMEEISAIAQQQSAEAAGSGNGSKTADANTADSTVESQA